MTEVGGGAERIRIIHSLFTPQMPVKALLQFQLPANAHSEVMAPVFGSCNPLGRPGVPDSWGWPGPGSRSLHSEPAAGRARSHSVCTCTCICLENSFKSHVIDRNMGSISSQTHEHLFCHLKADARQKPYWLPRRRT